MDVPFANVTTDYLTWADTITAAVRNDYHSLVHLYDGPRCHVPAPRVLAVWFTRAEHDEQLADLRCQVAAAKRVRAPTLAVEAGLV